MGVRAGHVPGGGGPAEIVWREQNVWSRAATAAKARLDRLRLATLILAIAGAVLGTLSAAVAERSETGARAIAFGSAAALALSSYLVHRTNQAQVEDWIRLRAVAEELKAEVYAFLAGVKPYRDPDAGRLLLDRTDRLTTLSRLGRYTGGIEPVDRPLPDVRDVATYITQRIRPQIDDYYRPRAALMHRRLTLARRGETILGSAAAVLGVIAGFGIAHHASAWIGVVTTVTGAIAAHVAASRWEYQEVEYQLTAAQLERLLAGRSASVDPPDDDGFVAECERVISVQNEGWMARWTGPDGAAGS